MDGSPVLAAALGGVRLHVLLTGVRTAPLDLAASAVEAGALLLYGIGIRRVARRGRRWPARQAAAFAGGVLCIWIAVGSGLAAYDEASVTLHIVQHILLMMAAPPLLALGRPLLLAAQASGRGIQVGINRFMRSRFVSVITHPAFATPVYFVTMWAMLVDRGVYDYLIAHQPVHELSHAVLLAVGLLYWPPLVAPETSRHRLSFQARMLLLLGSMPLEALPGGWMRFQPIPIDPINTLAGTHTVGEVFLVTATGACGVWLCAIAAQWFTYALREERREAAKAVSTEWSVPWWVQSADPAPGPAASEA